MAGHYQWRAIIHGGRLFNGRPSLPAFADGSTMVSDRISDWETQQMTTQTIPTLHFIAAAGAHRGRLRELNEDAVLALIRPPEGGLSIGFFAVADGMGGHQAGEVASRLALETLQESLSPFFEASGETTTPSTAARDPEGDTLPSLTSFLETHLRQAVVQANDAIYNYAQRNPDEAGNLGCTVTCALLQNHLGVIANVGDSRTYLLRHGQLQQVTEDHSYVGQLVRNGQLAPDDIYDHPQRNVVTRALGSQPEVEVDLWSQIVQAGDRLLLCSDGLWEMVRDPAAIARLLSQEDVEAAVRDLIDLANAEGGTDNIGVVVVAVVEAPAAG
jgi:PPM family protein phosphatase